MLICLGAWRFCPYVQEELSALRLTGHSWSVHEKNMEAQWKSLLAEKDRALAAPVHILGKRVPDEWAPQLSADVLVPMSSVEMTLELPCIDTVMKHCHVAFAKRNQSLSGWKQVQSARGGRSLGMVFPLTDSEYLRNPSRYNLSEMLSIEYAYDQWRTHELECLSDGLFGGPRLPLDAFTLLYCIRYLGGMHPDLVHCTHVVRVRLKASSRFRKVRKPVEVQGAEPAMMDLMQFFGGVRVYAARLDELNQ